MNRHIIEVIVQGYDRLSGVLRDASNKAGPALDNLNNKFRTNRNEAEKASGAVRDFTDDVDRSAVRMERARNSIDKMNTSFSRLRQNVSRKIFGETFTETPEEMYARLGREGQSPRAGGRFQSRADFVAQENARRAELQRNTLFQGRSPFDDVLRGFQTGAGFSQTKGQKDIKALLRIQAEERLAAYTTERQADRRRLEESFQDEKTASERKIAVVRDEAQKRIAAAENAYRKIERDADLALQKDKIRIRETVNEEVSALRSKARYSGKNEERLAEAQAARDEILNLREAAQEDITLAQKRKDAKVAAAKETFRVAANGERDLIAQTDREETASINRSISKRRKEFDQITAEGRRAIREAAVNAEKDLPGVIRDFNRVREDAIKDLPIIERGAARAGAAFSDFRRGVIGGKNGLEEFKGEALKAQSAVGQMGAAFGAARRDINSFINVRWVAILSIIQTLGPLIVQLGGALIALGSSAVVAAAGIGGAFLAGIAEAIPAVGLVVAAFRDLQGAMKVVQERQQARESAAQSAQASENARRSAVQQLADAHYQLGQAIYSVGQAERGLRDAHQQVTDAERAQREAVQGLADARQQAARNIVDAAFAEKDAELSLQEAVLGVLDAKQRLADFEKKQSESKAALSDAQAALQEAEQRLALAKQQGDAIEIAQAQAAVSVAKGNVNNLQDQISNTSTQQKELQLGVKRAQLTEQEARVRRRRAIQDDRKAQAQGIEGSPEVIAARQRIVDANRQYRQAIQGVADAQHGLRDAEHGVLLAHRQIHDATIAVAQATAQMGAQQRKAAQDFKALSPGQREFVLAIEDFKKKWKEAMQPVTDIIAGGIARALKRVSILLQDPEIHSALMSLAREIAGVADGFSKWIISPAGRRDILFFIRESVRNLPIIARAAGHFALALVNIAKAAAPLFRSIVDGFDRTGKKADHFTRNTSRLDRFFASAGRNLHAWVALAGAVGNLLAALIGVSAGTGLKMVNGMADAFNNLADRVRKNPEPVRKFFEQVRTSLAEILPLIGHLLLGLIRLFNSPAFGEFVKFMLQQMIPAIIDVMKVFSTFIKILNDFTRIPIIGPIIGYVIHLGILYFALIKLFPVLKTLTGLIGAMGKKTIIGIAIVAIYELYTHLGFLQKKFGALGEAIRVIASLMGGLLVIRMLKAYSSLGQLGSRVLVVAGDIAKTLVNAIKSLIIKEGEADAASGAGGLGGALGKLRGVIGGAGGGRGLASMIGKAGLAAAVGVLAFEATKAILHITGLDKKLAAFGAHAFDFISRSKTGQKIAGFLTGTDLSKVDRANQLDEIDAKYGAGNVSAAVLEYGRLRHKKGWTDTRALLRAARDHHIDPHDLATAMAPSIRPPGYEKGGTVAGSRQGAPVNAVVHVGEWILNKAQQLRLSALLGTPLNYIKNFLFGGTDTGKLPLFSAEGPQFYAAAFKHNRPFAKPGPYTTHLSDHEEAAFRRWVSRNSVPFDPNARLSDYDMRGFFKAMLRGAVPQWRRGSHFPDTWKTPYDTSFSHESKYATVDNPFYWVGNKLIDKRTGQTVFGDPARFADGGVVGSETATGKAINIIAHAGEWVLNKAQQMNLARKLGTTVEQAKAQIFGTSGIGPHNMPDGTSAKPSQGGSSYKNFDLVPYTDDYGIQLWFLKMSNGVWAQVTARDAKHIQQTKGSWLPTYINRRTRIPSISPSRGLGIARAFSGGGVVSFSMPGVRGYANGGVVGGPQINAPAGKRGGIDHFEQHFNVKTEGESDWHHIFRLGAQHVQAAY